MAGRECHECCRRRKEGVTPHSHVLNATALRARSPQGYGQTTSKIVAERGYGYLWAGYPWRLFRQLCALMLFDKIASEGAPMLFPHAFADKVRGSPGSGRLP